MGAVYSRWFYPLAEPPDDLILETKIPPGPICNDSHCSRDTCRLTESEIESAMRKLIKVCGIKQKTYNFAMAGVTGSGKSSLINCLRGLEEKDSGCAEYALEGDDRETTNVVTPYRHPNFAHVVLFDLPGGNTERHPSHGYFFQKACFAYDCIIVVITNRIQSTELDIIEQAIRWNIPWVLVRTRCDLAPKDKVRRQPDIDLATVKTTLRDELKCELTKQMNGRGIVDSKPVVFLVSAPVFQGWPDESNIDLNLDEHNLLVWLARTAMSRRGATVVNRDYLCDNCEVEKFSQVVVQPCGDLICLKCRDALKQANNPVCPVCEAAIDHVVLVDELAYVSDCVTLTRNQAPPGKPVPRSTRCCIA
ncbi:putative Interferon-inducible GTPase 1 [Hypsibius exemplaris]|uniref:Interferon-inducible GTPase 1 n=1 Tax=Hypsibius exemplaris TaxID=2072580 RepID=A0A9X6RJI8_HYPEX|nr:putative Interferon-inducible GTPase 1 [Hypsibius exemplaris]